MKRILIVNAAILSLGLLLSGCAMARSGSNPQASNSQGLVQASPQAATKTDAQAQKPTPAEVDAQTEKVQNEIDKLLNDLDKDTDGQNIYSEAK